MGVYMLNRDVLKFLPDGSPYGFDELMLDLMKAKQRPAVRTFDGYWLDIGRPDDYMRAIDEFDEMQMRLLGDKLDNP
jgi:NDP-sugar pyrophosphorylase family protein